MLTFTLGAAFGAVFIVAIAILALAALGGIYAIDDGYRPNQTSRQFSERDEIEPFHGEVQ